MKATRKRIRTSCRTNRRTASDALHILDRVTGHDEKLRALIKEATISAEIAEKLLSVRMRANLNNPQPAL